jgi:hypothetical protein
VEGPSVPLRLIWISFDLVCDIASSDLVEPVRKCPDQHVDELFEEESESKSFRVKAGRLEVNTSEAEDIPRAGFSSQHAFP